MELCDLKLPIKRIILSNNKQNKQSLTIHICMYMYMVFIKERMHHMSPYVLQKQLRNYHNSQFIICLLVIT